MRDIIIFETTQHMGNGINLTNISEELVPQSFTFCSASHQAGNINKFQLCGDDIGGLR